VIFSLDIGYGSVKKMIEILCGETSAKHVEAHINFEEANLSE